MAASMLGVRPRVAGMTLTGALRAPETRTTKVTERQVSKRELR